MGGFQQEEGTQRLRLFVPAAAELCRKRDAEQMGPKHQLSMVRTALRLGRQVSTSSICSHIAGSTLSGLGACMSPGCCDSRRTLQSCTALQLSQQQHSQPHNHSLKTRGLSVQTQHAFSFASIPSLASHPNLTSFAHIMQLCILAIVWLQFVTVQILCKEQMASFQPSKHTYEGATSLNPYNTFRYRWTMLL